MRIGFLFGVFFCSYIQRLLDRISNGTLPDDRRTAILELQSVVAESNAAQLAFGASGKCLFFLFYVTRLIDCEIKSKVTVYILLISGFPVILGILKEQRDDVEMVLYLLFSYFLCFPLRLSIFLFFLTA